MKLIFTLLLAIGLVQFSFAQNFGLPSGLTYPNDATVRIGNSWTDPDGFKYIGIGVDPVDQYAFIDAFDLLHAPGGTLNLNSTGGKVNIGGNDSDASARFTINDLNSSGLPFIDIKDYQSNYLLRMANNGNLGIGTATPSEKLDVSGNISSGGTKIGFGTTDAFTAYSSSTAHYGISYGTGDKPLALSGYYGLGFFTYGAERIRISLIGNVGIGTTTPDEKLTVKGKIHAEEIKVDLSVPGPDYVFEKQYQLTPLTEVQKYIELNKHLPEVPSAKDMEKNGINLSEMNMLLLKKVEELTLHLIEQNERIKELEKR